MIFCLTVNYFCYAQETLTSEEALDKYKALTEVMEKSFPEDEYLTYRRESFSEEQLHNYLLQQYKRLDLLPSINGHYAFKMNSYLHSGNWFKKTGFPSESIQWYNTFFEYYKKNHNKLSINEKDEFIEMVSYSHSLQAENYIGIGKLDSAALEHKRNIAFIKDKNHISNPSAFNNYGLYFYWNKKDLDSAFVYFNMAFKITREKFPNHTLIGSIRDNLADIYLEKNQPERALGLYKVNVDFYSSIEINRTKHSDESHKTSRLISAVAQQIAVQLQLKQSAQAAKSIKKLEAIIIDPRYKNLTPNSELEILKAQEAFYLNQNNFKKTYDIALKHRALKDSINAVSNIVDGKWQKELSTISLNRAAINFKIDKMQKEIEIKSQRLRLWIISIVSLSIIGILTAFYLRRRGLIVIAKNKLLITEQNLKLTDLENMQLSIEIESKKRDLSDFAINLHQNQEWAKILANKLKKLKSTKGRERKKLLDEFELDVKNKISFDIDSKEFYQRLDKLSDSFYSQLNTNFPNLSKTDKRLCSLIRLKIDSNEIATLQNITLSSLNTSRYRLRRKLNLPKRSNLDDFIQRL